MDFSANLHHQLLQLENQLLLGVGSSHAWTPDISMSPSCDFEPNFNVQDLNSAIDAESFTSLQHSHGSNIKDNKFEKDEKVSANSSCSDHHKIATIIEETLNSSSSHNCRFEELNKISESCCCCSSKKMIDVNNVCSRKKPLMMSEFSTSNLGGFDHITIPFASSLLLTKIPNHEIPQAKRPCTSKPTQSTSKKSRVESRATCPPLKIRKEKLGDRIAALQQLVAPFGKTDTASVLMEAINYINFLQNQVEMLSHSYMKSCRTKNYKTIYPDELNEKDQKPESDLKGKGLCLVPLACISYLPEDTSNGGRIGSFWPPLAVANFNRRTF